MRNIPAKAASAVAEKSARAASEAPARAMLLDLRPLIAPFRERGRLTIRIENLPQSARLSAGQNNGDRTWSLAQDELDDLSYFPPTGIDEDHALTVRLIAKDELGASTVAVLEIRPSGVAKAEAAPQLRLAGKNGQGEAAADDSLRQELAQLKNLLASREQELGKLLTAAGQDGALRQELEQLQTALAARESELGQLRAVLDQVDTQTQEKIDAALWAAESIWKGDEQARLNALRAELQAQIERAEAERRAEKDARASQEQDAAAFRQAQGELARAQQLLSGQDGELKRLLAEVEQAKRARDTEVAGIRQSAEAQAVAAAQRQAESDAALADIAAQRDATQAALAAAQTSGNEIAQQQQAELERLRHECQSLAAAKAAAESYAAERLKSAQIQWEQQTARALTDIATRCEVAEVALAAARATNASDNRPNENHQAEVAQLQAELDRLRREAAAAKSSVDASVTERLKTAQAQWEAETAKALSDVLVRCETAEQALATARDAPQSGNRDAELAQLQSELEGARRQAQELSAASAQADRRAADTLKSAQAQWQQQTTQSLMELTTRAQVAEAALAVARTNESSRTESDAYIRSLNREIKTLQSALVDREAALGRAQASLEQLRFGAETRGPAAQWNPLPGGSYPREDRQSDNDANTHLMRDVAILFLIVLVGILAFPRIEAMLPDNIRWQIETGGGLFAPAGTSGVNIPVAPPVAHVTPRTEHLATVTRGMNLRDQPSVSGALVASLKRGAQVTILESRGNWDRISMAGAAGEKDLQGWVYNTYIQDGIQAGIQAGIQDGVQAATQAGAQTGAQTGTPTGNKAGAKAGTQAGAQADTEAGIQADAQGGAQGGVQADAQAGAQGGAQADIQDTPPAKN